MWHRIAAETVKGRNMQPAYVEVDVDGVTIGDFIAYNHALNKNGDTTAPFKQHLAVEFSNALTYAARKKSVIGSVFNAVVILKKALTRK